MTSAVYIRRLIDRCASLFLCLILAGFGYAGLFPFDPSPENRVSWIDGEDGVDFRRGSLFGYRPGEASAGSSCSVELYIRLANNRGSATLLSFYDDTHHGRLRIEQNGTRGLWVTRENGEGFEEMWMVHPFTPGDVTLITIAGDSVETRVYFDGRIAGTFPQFQLTGSDCSGSFVLGTGVTSDSTWSGSLLGVAFYPQTLTAADVVRHFGLWSAGVFHESEVAVAPAALYRFDERAGAVVHNRVTGEGEIEISDVFRVPVRRILEGPSMAAIRKHGPDWSDIVINVGGFVPFGFFLLPALTTSRRNSLTAILLAIGGGILVSLLIEITQAWLPTRTSSITDVVTNGLGTALGVILYLRLFGRRPPLSSSPKAAVQS